MEYSKNNKPDTLSIGCFVFVELTLLTKIILRSAAIIGINATYTNGSLSDFLATNRGDSPLVCTYDLAYFFGVMFFTIALIMNAVRWLYLILFI